ncbi:hypothetical protein OAG16_04070 [Saprospiraceae bacterium]|nr:hypothetical protein [Saprospiraceae bacterium]
MKKNLLTLMLFFAFLIAGIQDVSAQFVNENQALVIVQTEIQTIESNSFNPNTQEKTPYYAANSAKLEFLQAVNLRLLDGESVADAIIQGVHLAAVADYVVEPITDAGEVFRTPLHQEIVDLLSL